MKREGSHIRDRHRAIIAQGQPPCHLCGADIDYSLPHTDEMSFVADHVVPLARGGSGASSNLRAAHRRPRICNARKGAKEYAPIIKRSGVLRNP